MQEKDTVPVDQSELLDRTFLFASQSPWFGFVAQQAAFSSFVQTRNFFNLDDPNSIAAHPTPTEPYRTQTSPLQMKYKNFVEHCCSRNLAPVRPSLGWQGSWRHRQRSTNKHQNLSAHEDDDGSILTWLFCDTTKHSFCKPFFRQNILRSESLEGNSQQAKETEKSALPFAWLFQWMWELRCHHFCSNEACTNYHWWSTMPLALAALCVDGSAGMSEWIQLQLSQCCFLQSQHKTQWACLRVWSAGGTSETWIMRIVLGCRKHTHTCSTAQAKFVVHWNKKQRKTPRTRRPLLQNWPGMQSRNFQWRIIPRPHLTGTFWAGKSASP